MPIPKATPEVCDKPADDYAYALMIGCIQSGFSFLGPFKAEDEALQAWDEHLERDDEWSRTGWGSLSRRQLAWVILRRLEAWT